MIAPNQLDVGLPIIFSLREYPGIRLFDSPGFKLAVNILEAHEKATDTFGGRVEQEMAQTAIPEAREIQYRAKCGRHDPTTQLTCLRPVIYHIR